VIRLSSSPQLHQAASRGDIGAVIRFARRARGETQAQTAAACGFTQSDISRLEGGKRHTHDVRFLEKLAAHLFIPPNLLGLADGPVQAEPSESAVNRREFLTGAAVALTAAALPIPAFDFEPVDRIADIRAVTATYRRMDSTLSSHDLIQPVAAHLQMTHRLFQRTTDGRTRAWLAESLSETASLAAWLAWDSANYDDAENRYRGAVKLADAATHPLLTAYQLGSLASFMIDHQDRNASNVLALARHKLGPRPAAVADSWMSSLEAMAYATMGYERDSWAALDRADELSDRIDDHEPPWPWVFSFNHDKIAMQRVVCAATTRPTQPGV
jgi:transcriptional regulator with XRE-family HTH domain